MKKVLFIDRDGTLVLEPEDYQLDAFNKLIFYPQVFTYLGKIARELDYTLVMVTNQDGLGTESFPENTFWPVHNLLLKSLEQEGIFFEEVLIDRSLPKDSTPTRKPKTGMLTQYFDVIIVSCNDDLVLIIIDHIQMKVALVSAGLR